MKRKTLKGLIATVAAFAVFTFSAVFGGCFAGKDGKDGKDLNIYDLYEAAKTIEGNENMTFEEFLREYLSYTPQEIEEQINLQKSINRSLLSSVYVRAVMEESDGKPLYYSGTGVIIDIDKTAGDMTVLTNCHVVYSTMAVGDRFADEIQLWNYGSELYIESMMTAKIMCASITYDLALLKVTGSDVVKGSDARAASFASTEVNYLGETVYTVGNPNAQRLAASCGTISRDFDTLKIDMDIRGSDMTPEPDIYKDMRTYDVMRLSIGVDHGNSGGGVFDKSGQLIGVLNAKSGTMENTAYALPAARVRRVVARMLGDYTGVETHSFMRVNWEEKMELELYNAYPVLNDEGLVDIKEVVTVKSSHMNSPFSQFVVGDVLSHIKVTRGGEVIEDLDINRKYNFNDAMISVKEGDTVTVTVLRGGTPRELTMTFTRSDFKTED